MYIYIYVYIYIYIYIYIYEKYKQEEHHCVSFEISFFSLNHKENKVLFFTELFQKHSLLYQYGDYRMSMSNGVTDRGMWFPSL